MFLARTRWGNRTQVRLICTPHHFISLVATFRICHMRPRNLTWLNSQNKPRKLYCSCLLCKLNEVSHVLFLLGMIWDELCESKWEMRRLLSSHFFCLTKETCIKTVTQRDNKTFMNGEFSELFRRMRSWVYNIFFLETFQIVFFL